MVKRIVVGAHYGLIGFLTQRITAVLMAVYLIAVPIVLFSLPFWQYRDWQALFRNQWMRFATLLFLISLFFHAWTGMRDIYMDYVQPTAIRLSLEVLTIVALAFYAIWSVQILWGV